MSTSCTHRIFKASRRGDVKLFRRLQKLLIKSQAAKLLATGVASPTTFGRRIAESDCRVTQDNQGRKTAGVDGIKLLTPKQRLALTDKLKLGSKVAPTRRVWIPKPGKEEKRPLGIPTMYDTEPIGSEPSQKAMARERRPYRDLQNWS